MIWGFFFCAALPPDLRLLLCQHHFPRLYELLSVCSHRFQPVEIDPGRYHGVPLGGVFAGGLVFVEENGYFAAEHVVNTEADVACHGQLVSNYGCGIKRIGIVLVEPE